MSIFEKWKNGMATIVCHSREECEEFVQYFHGEGIEYIGKDGPYVTYWDNSFASSRGYNCSKVSFGKNCVTTFAMFSTWSSTDYDDFIKDYAPLKEVFDFNEFKQEEFRDCIDINNFTSILLDV